MAEPLGNFVQAVTGVQQTRGDQVPDLMRPERPNPGGDSELVEPVGLRVADVS